MLKAFALDPCVPADDSTAFAVFVAGLGVENGRLLAEFPKRWRAMAIDLIHSLGSNREAKRAEALLTRLATDGTLRTRLALPFDPNRSWLENASQHQAAFAAIICADGAAEPSSTPWAHPASTLVEGATYWQASRYGVFKNTATNLAGLLGPLLRLDSEVAFMDPFFDAARDHYLKSIEAVLDAAPNVKRLVVHSAVKVGRNNSPVPADRWQAVSRERLSPLLRQDLTISLVRWRELDQSEDPHERWVVTPRGAATLDRGFAADGKINAYNLLPCGEAARRWRTYGMAPYSGSPYALDGELALR